MEAAGSAAETSVEPGSPMVRQEAVNECAEIVEQADGADGYSMNGNASEVAETGAAAETGDGADANEGGGEFDDLDLDIADVGDAGDDRRDEAGRDAGVEEGRVAEWDQGVDGQDGVEGGMDGGAVAAGGRDEEVPLEEFLGLRGPVRHMVCCLPDSLPL